MVKLIMQVFLYAIRLFINKLFFLLEFITKQGNENSV
jgi:hypothetical protein